MIIKKMFSTAIAIDVATKMLRKGKSFSETAWHIEQTFAVEVDHVMASAINKYRFSFA